jgi:hypothetical protein
MKRKSTFNSFVFIMLSLMLGFSIQQLSANNFSNSSDREDRSISGFTELEVSGAFEIVLTQGNTESLTIEADENIMGNIKTRITGNTLEIYTKGTIRNYRVMRVYITFKQLESIDLSGAVKVTADQSLQFDRLDLDISGACIIEFDMEADRLDLDLSGASKLYLNGYANYMDADCSGSSKLMLSGLKTKRISFESSGASTAEFWVTESLDVESSGASNVRYKGNPATVNVENSGASSVKKM